jgi:hypothetical protein
VGGKLVPRRGSNSFAVNRCVGFTIVQLARIIDTEGKTACATLTTDDNSLSARAAYAARGRARSAPSCWTMYDGTAGLVE